MENIQLSPHFTLYELTNSSTAKQYGIKNEPNETQIQNLKRLCNEVLEPVRDRIGCPLFISSGYRGERLNALVGGSKTTQHKFGQACDIQIYHKSLNNKDLFNLCVEMIKSGEIKVGQLIWEYGEDIPNWVHISIPYKKTNQVLKASKKYDKHYGKYVSVYEDLSEELLK